MLVCSPEVILQQEWLCPRKADSVGGGGDASENKGTMPRCGLTGAQAQHIIFQLFPPEVPATVAIFGFNPDELARQGAEREAFAALPLIEQNARKIADLERMVCSWPFEGHHLHR